MARYRSTVTDDGRELLASIIARGDRLQITRVTAGTGRTDLSPNTLTELVEPAGVSAEIGDLTHKNDYLQLPIQLTNDGLSEDVYIREIGVFSEGTMVIYAWIDGEDSDNLLPPTGMSDGSPDTIHSHMIGIYLTDDVVVEASIGSYLTYQQMEAYAAPLSHTHEAEEVTESTGETTEQAQRRQDYEIVTLKQALDSGFTGTTVTHRFHESELQHWKGYPGPYLDGVVDTQKGILKV